MSGDGDGDWVFWGLGLSLELCFSHLLWKEFCGVWCLVLGLALIYPREKSVTDVVWYGVVVYIQHLPTNFKKPSSYSFGIHDQETSVAHHINREISQKIFANTQYLDEE